MIKNYFFVRIDHSFVVNKTSTVGKENCDITISDFSVSPMHCEFRVEGEDLYLKDLGSKNGTFLNGQRLKPHVEVKIDYGDKIIIGSVEYAVSASEKLQFKIPALNEILTVKNIRTFFYASRLEKENVLATSILFVAFILLLNRNDIDKTSVITYSLLVLNFTFLFCRFLRFYFFQTSLVYSSLCFFGVLAIPAYFMLDA